MPPRRMAKARGASPSAATGAPIRGMLEAELIRGLTEGGIDVVQIGMGPSPMLYFATHYLDVDGGIQVTGSHNPADYNGFKLLLKGRSVFGAGDPGARPARRRGRLARRQRDGRGGRHPRGLCRPAAAGLLGQAVPHRLGRRQRRRGSDPRHAGRAAARPASRDLQPRSTATSPTTIPIRRSKPISPT